MGKYEVGNIFGDFKIIQRVDTGKKYDYVFKCQCVNCGYVENRSANVLGFRKNLCKKCNKEYNSHQRILKTYDDMIGKRFGNLVIETYIGKRGRSHAYFDCICDCGRHCIKKITYLNSDKIKHMCPSCEKSNVKQSICGNETFVPVDGFDDYLIGSCGSVISNKNGYPIVMKPWLDSKGKYYYIALCKNGETYKKAIHQLVAHAFVDGYKDGLVPNHIDTNTHNNSATNLEWVTLQRNTVLGYKKLPPDRNRIRCILVFPNGEKKEFNSTAEVRRYGIENNLDFSPTGLCRYCKSRGFKLVKLEKMSNQGRCGISDKELLKYMKKEAN